MFFCDGKEKSVWCLKAILRSFELASGLKVNFAKSNVIGINIHEEVIEGISNFLACKVGLVPFKFLGVPVGANPRRASTWQYVIDNMRARLNSWRSRQLSMGGRVTLINSVLSSLPLYLFSFYKTPRKVIDEIVKIQRRFLWGGHSEHKKMAWVRWDLICLPKSQGGLGVKNLEAFNLSLLSKWRWRVLTGNEDCLWKKILVHRYGLVESWNGEITNEREWTKCSLWWRDLKALGAGTQLPVGWFNEIAKKKMGNGTSVKFWTDIWLGREPLAVLFPELFAKSLLKEAWVAEMGEWGASVWRWTVEQYPSSSLVEADAAAEFRTLLVDVAPVRDSPDSWRWILDSTNGFSVKKCYGWVLNFFAGTGGALDVQFVAACRKLWRTDVPSKVLIFSWRLLLNRLATRDALSRRGVLNSTQDCGCVFCPNDEESVSHLFFDCDVSREVWSRVMQWFGSPVIDELDALGNFVRFGNILKGKKRKGVKYIIWMAVVWCLWNTRNNIIFKGEAAVIPAMVEAIKFTAWSWFMARRGRNCGATWEEWLTCPMGCFLSL